MDHEKEIVYLRGEVATLKANVENLVGWQHSQNGAIHRVDTKVDNLIKLMLGTAGTAALSFLGTIVTLLVVLANRG